MSVEAPEASSFHRLELPKCLNRLGGDLTSGRVCCRCTIGEIDVVALGLDTGNSTIDVGEGGA
jgi:hypothetical protein